MPRTAHLRSVGAVSSASSGEPRIRYDELAYLHENAEEFGLTYEGTPLVRRRRLEVQPGRALSALVWGDAEPELVLVHGGAQNAHTWDTVALALGRPLVAVDLGGHGHSDRARSEPPELSAPERQALDLAPVVATLAPAAKAVVGMSLGGLSSIALAANKPHLVRALVLVDVTPGVTADKARSIVDFVSGPATFASFDELLARTIEFNPTRTESSLRRGILHNAMQLDDGSWMWRYRRHDPAGGEEGGDRIAADHWERIHTRLWDALGSLDVPVMLVRGMRQQSVVDDADEAELLRRLPAARVEHVAEAGHSVQGDTPVVLAELLDDFVP